MVEKHAKFFASENAESVSRRNWRENTAGR